MPDPDGIANWQRIDDAITTSGKLNDTDIAKLAEAGIRHVINLAMDSHPEALAGEGRKLAAAGIAYTHIPVPFDAPSDVHFDTFRQVLEEGPQPVHIHCIMNWRVSAFLYRYNVEFRSMPEADARRLMERQWSPDTSDNPSAPVWRSFIRGET